MNEPNKHPKISIITLVRNGAAFMDRCLQSVANQGYDNIEYIVLDGASTDGTQAIIERYKPILSYYHSRPDKGPYDAATQGLAIATGEMVGFLMADDWLAPEAAQTLANLYQQQPNADIFCFGMQEYKQDEQHDLHKTRVFLDPQGERFRLFDGLYCHGLNRFFSMRIMQQEVYARNQKYPQLADRDFYVRLGKRDIEKAWTPDILYHVVVHPGSNSTGGTSDKIARFLEETSWIADEYLADKNIKGTDRVHLVDWYCFNKIRSCWFLLKSKAVGKLLICSLQLGGRYPLATIKNLIKWRIPLSYRPVVTHER